MAELDLDAIRLDWLDYDELPEPLESELESFSGVSVQDGGGRVGKAREGKNPHKRRP
jgi:hypothetical protein